MGPIVWVSSGAAPGTIPASEYRFVGQVDGRSPQTPQKPAGMRTEPPVSSPSPSGTMRAARAAAVPPLDPPGMRSRSYGLRTNPNVGLDEVTPYASSCML